MGPQIKKIKQSRRGIHQAVIPQIRRGPRAVLRPSWPTTMHAPVKRALLKAGAEAQRKGLPPPDPWAFVAGWVDPPKRKVEEGVEKKAETERKVAEKEQKATIKGPAERKLDTIVAAPKEILPAEKPTAVAPEPSPRSKLTTSRYERARGSHRSVHKPRGVAACRPSPPPGSRFKLSPNKFGVNGIVKSIEGPSGQRESAAGACKAGRSV